ncbi:hypothetical protein LL999_00100 [Burkholderia ambifaria]|uniref:hypothetical protein n=1 Tax=Burkholderia ambifaria TaxID=152480 RepID=UPI001E4F892F|nr:hypothetical protein [Burkholderia ambifaria]UEP21410.1 hypothetical protein LL999_00100 [Burkholderia ambifaria]
MLTVLVHSIGIRFRIGYPHRSDRLDAFVDGRALFGFGLTGFGVVSALDIHIGRNGFAAVACRIAHLWVAQDFEWL